jgi:hypothetical protein
LLEFLKFKDREREKEYLFFNQKKTKSLFILTEQLEKDQSFQKNQQKQTNKINNSL